MLDILDARLAQTHGTTPCIALSVGLGGPLDRLAV
jgi:hypothetical protein